jgi:hypothetical protein
MSSGRLSSEASLLFAPAHEAGPATQLAGDTSSSLPGPHACKQRRHHRGQLLPCQQLQVKLWARAPPESILVSRTTTSGLHDSTCHSIATPGLLSMRDRTSCRAQVLKVQG